MTILTEATAATTIPVITRATPAEIRLADLVHARVGALPEGPESRYLGRWIFLSAIWTDVLDQRDSLLWHAFTRPAHWGGPDRDDGGYGLKTWLCHAACLRDGAGAPLVLLGDATGAVDADPDAVRRSEFCGPVDQRDPGSPWARFHCLVDRRRDPDAYRSRRAAPTSRSTFSPPRHPATRE